MPTHATLHRSEPVRPATGPAAGPAPPSPAPLSPAPLSPAPLSPARLSPARLSPVARRRARLAALAVGGFLVPWCVVLSVTLPRTAQAQNWSLAWTGLDAAEAVAALATAALLARDDSRASLTAAAGGALLMVDAWFDVCTSVPGPRAHAGGLRGGPGRTAPGLRRGLARGQARPADPVTASGAPAG